MKKFIISLISLLVSFTFIFVTVPSVAVADSSTIVEIPNSGFETISSHKDKNMITSWILEPSYRVVSKNTETAYSGQSLKIEKGFTFTLTLGDYLSVENGKSYTFGYKCLAESNVALATISVQVFDVELEKIETFTSDKISVNSEGWQDVSVTADFNENAASVKLILTVDTSSNKSPCYVDEVYGYYNEAVAAVTTFTGASLRLALDSPGIRFAGSVNKDVYDEYVKNYTEVSAGILITLEEYLTGKTDFTVDALGDNPYVEITAEKWFNQNTVDTDGYYGFYCAIIKINQKNIEKRYCARSYVKYKDGEKFRYVYGNFSLSDNARSVKETAELAMEELELYSDEQAEIIRYFAEFNN